MSFAELRRVFTKWGWGLEGFELSDTADFYREYNLVPYLTVIVYLGIIIWHLQRRNPVKYEVKFIFTIWNLLLAVFSICGATIVFPDLVRRVAKDGVLRVLTFAPDAPDGYARGQVGFWVFAFCLSKFPELIDTAFHIIRCRHISFLHWFHHATVLLYCWIAFKYASPSGLWFAAMNLVVHSAMYSYYFIHCVFGRAPLGPLITIMQITQMVVGVAVTGATWYLHLAEPGPGKLSYTSHPAVLVSATLMYSAYLVLFVNFFLSRYVFSSSGGPRGDSPSPARSPVAAKKSQ